MILHKHSGVLRIALAAAVIGWQAVIAQAEVISVSLALRTPDSQGIPGIAYVAFTPTASGWAETDEAGNATIQLDVKADDVAVEIRHENYADHFRTPAEQSATRTRLSQMLSRYYYPYISAKRAEMTVNLQPGVRTYAVTFQMEESVCVSGRVVDARGLRPMLHAVVSARFGNEGMPSTDRQGMFKLLGVPKGRDNEIYVYTEDGIVTLTLTAQGTMEDVVIPEVRTIDASGPNGMADITMTHTGDLLNEYGRLVSGGATLIRSDGLIFPLFPGPDGRVERMPGRFPVRLPVGEYTLVPGFFRAADFQLVIRDAVTSGQALKTTAVPRFVVKDGETLQMRCDTKGIMSDIQRTYALGGPANRIATMARAATTQPSPAKAGAD